MTNAAPHPVDPASAAKLAAQQASLQGEAALDLLLARHEAPALPPGLVARIVREVPLQPQMAALGGGMAGATGRGTVVPLRLVSAAGQERVDPRRGIGAHMAGWRARWLMVGGTGLAAVAAGFAGIALINAPQEAAIVAAPAAGSMAATAPQSVQVSPPVALAVAGPASTATSAAAPKAGLAPRATTAALPAAQAPALDDSDPNPMVTPAEPDSAQLAAESPDPGPQRSNPMGPSLGTSRGGTMGPFVPQGYGYSGAIGGSSGGMGPGGAPVPGTMQPLPGRMPGAPSLP